MNVLNINLLVIDDEQIILDSVKRILKNEGFDIFTALHARDALQLIQEHDIDIVLTDLMMPDMDGLELLKSIKREYPEIIVIMITGYATISTALKAMQNGAFDYIAKPFTKDELRKVIVRASELVIDPSRMSMKDKSHEKVSIEKHIKDPVAYSWMMKEDDGRVLLGVERTFLFTIGRIQSVYLPSIGDEIWQGSAYFQVFSADMRSHTLLSPLSGTVAEVNEKVLENPNETLMDPYGEGWLIRLLPSDFDDEIKIMGF